MENIKDIAISSETRNVRIPIDTEKLEEMREEFVKKSLDFKRIADEKAASMAVYKEAMTPLQKEINQLLEDIQNEFEETDTTVYLLDDQDANVMRYYLEDGTEVFSRPLRPDEKQLHLLNNKIKEA